MVRPLKRRDVFDHPRVPILAAEQFAQLPTPDPVAGHRDHLGQSRREPARGQLPGGDRGARRPKGSYPGRLKGWSIICGMGTEGIPARNAATIGRAPVWRTAAAIWGNSQAWGTSPIMDTFSSSISRPAQPACTTAGFHSCAGLLG